MEMIKLNSWKAENFIKKGLSLICFPEDVEILSYVGDGNKAYFQIQYEKERNGIMEKHIRVLPRRDVVGLMMLAMILDGYDVESISIKTRKNEIYYEVSTSMVSYGDGSMKHKRRG